MTNFITGKKKVKRFCPGLNNFYPDKNVAVSVLAKPMPFLLAGVRLLGSVLMTLIPEHRGTMM